MKILIACEFSGIVRDAFIARGHDALSCDLLPTEKDGPHYQGDVFDIINDGWDMMIAHPPCTYLANIGNSWFDESKYGEAARERKQAREQAAEFFMKLINAPIPRVCVENPVGAMSTRYQKPTQYIQPYWFGDKEQKKTCLWLRGLSPLTETKNVGKPEPRYIGRKNGRQRKIYFVDSQPMTTDRWKIRSRTFPGIAAAMAAQWG